MNFHLDGGTVGQHSTRAPAKWERAAWQSTWVLAQETIHTCQIAKWWWGNQQLAHAKDKIAAQKSRGVSTIQKVTPHQPTIGAKGNGGPAINDGTKRNQLMVAQWPEKFNHNYTLNNCASQSGKKSINAQVKRIRHCKSKNSKAE